MSLSPRNVLIALSLTLFITSAFPVMSAAQNPAAFANIFMYPKPHQVADLTFSSPNGQPVSLKDFRGKVVLLHFWSINCPACNLEEPLLEDLKRNFGSSGLEILAINLVDPPQAILSHANSRRTPFPILVDGGRGFSLRAVEMGGKKTSFLVNPMREAILEIPGFPTTYILDCRGSAVGYSVGVAKWDSQYAQAVLRNLLTDTRTCLPGPRSANAGGVHATSAQR